MATTFTARQQLIRTAMATLSPAQFAGLRTYLDAVRVQTDGRLAQIEAERTALLARKQKLDAALQRLTRNDAFDSLRSALQRGERLRTQAQPAVTRPTKTPVKRPAKTPAKRPAKRPGR
jgi:hypothetical protein